MLQQPEPDDYVLATGETHSVRELAEKAFKLIGLEIEWQGKGVDEKGVVKKVVDVVEALEVVEVVGGSCGVKEGDVVIEVDPRYFRPTEVDILIGDATKAREKLGWRPRHSFEDLIRDMVFADLELAKKEVYLKNGGYRVRRCEE